MDLWLPTARNWGLLWQPSGIVVGFVAAVGDTTKAREWLSKGPIGGSMAAIGDTTKAHGNFLNREWLSKGPIGGPMAAVGDTSRTYGCRTRIVVWVPTTDLFSPTSRLGDFRPVIDFVFTKKLRLGQAVQGLEARAGTRLGSSIRSPALLSFWTRAAGFRGTGSAKLKLFSNPS